MEIKGKVIFVSEIASGTSKSGNAWQKCEFCIETDGQYPKKVCFTLFGDRVKICPKVGDVVNVGFDIDAHDYNGRWFNQINAWKVEAVGTTQAQCAAAPQQAPQQPATETPFPPQQPTAAQDSDDIPF